MKRQILLLIFSLIVLLSYSQQMPQKEIPKIYRASAEKINDLIHTKLDARFDFSKAYMYGKVWITLKPHFYPTDSLALDAKGMDIKQVAMIKNGKSEPLKFKYNGWVLDITLDKIYRNNEDYTIYIDYIAKPNELDVKGSAAITDAKGLYFINPDGTEKGKPTQIWTQGETEATSVWCPTIDKPNQKTTDEISMTVPSRFVTLSNGKLINQKTNPDGTRTDTWRMDLPHAPYLFFMGAGDFAVIKDAYKGKEVSYYLEKEYAAVARKIFGNTPDMITLFSKLTGVDYPWAKYAQIVGRDYVSGAMENTTATLHSADAQQDARELTDGNHWEDVIAHELFHQWFGDYVTTESWSNITVNESFATIGSQLWNEFHYGKDAGDAERYKSVQEYIMSGSDKKDLVRFYYADKEDVFDAVSYNKGGGILQMLRNFVGDSAFFRSLNVYLNTNKFKSGEAHQLRLAFEEVTGKDLNWFFNQWYFSSGHPKLSINSSYDNSAKKAMVIVEQTQSGDKVFQLPVAIDIYNGSEKNRFNVWVKNKIDTFYFNTAVKPDLINFDGDKILIAQKTENKSLQEYLHQYKYAAKYIDRREAIDAAGKKQDDPKALEIFTLAINDKYAPLRTYAIGKLDMRKDAVRSAFENNLAMAAQKEIDRPAKAAAISKLSDLKQTKYISLFKTAIHDSSYTVSGNALEALGKIDSVSAYNEAKRLAAIPAKGKLAAVITRTMIRFGDESSAGVILKNFEDMPLSQAKFEALQPLMDFLAKVNNAESFKRGVDDILKFQNAIPQQFKSQLAPFIEGLLRNLQKSKASKGQQELANYIDTKLKTEKGF